MNKFPTILYRVLEQVIPWSVLALLLFLTYTKFFQHPYVGFTWNSSGPIVFIFTEGNNRTPVQPGDRLLQVDTVTWEEYKQDLRKPLIGYLKPGQLLQLRVERNGQMVNIPWVAPGPNPAEINYLLWSEGWLAFLFWFLGTLSFLNLRPRNERWRLLSAFNFLTSIWLTAGSQTIYHTGGSAIFSRVFVWLCVPVYLHLHWVMPKPLGKLSPRLVWSAYLFTAILVVAQLFQLLPQNLYYLGFLLSIAGSLVLLVMHAVRQPEVRQELRPLLLIALLSFLPSLIISLLGAFILLPAGVAGLGLLSLPLLPLAYVYAAQRRQLGQLELRFNQALSVYIYAILLMLVLVPFLALLNLWITGPGSTLVSGVIVSILAVVFTIFAFRRVQAFIERAVLGISLPPRDLPELYSEQITTSTSLSGLQTLLETEILPRLHIRQFAFLQIETGKPHMLYAMDVDSQDMHIQNASALAGLAAGKYRPVEIVQVDDPFAWLRLKLELKISGEVLGLWLFGRRDPDDFFSQAEISLLQSLANQTAIALSNILQSQRVLEMYQQDISRHEQERMRLALDLHDSILNQMAVMLLNLDDQSITPRFQAAYDELTGRLREIVSDLRPAMLNYGLKPALEELVESLVERNKNNLECSLELQPAEDRYPADVEQHLFRILQEACENAIRHGKARKISITGMLLPHEINLTIADNGKGFDAGKGFELAGLLANRHFGLAGMLERARLIGGDVKIDSAPLTGTRVSFRWTSMEV